MKPDWRAAFFARLADWRLEATLRNGDQVWIGPAFGVVVPAAAAPAEVDALLRRLRFGIGPVTRTA